MFTLALALFAIPAFAQGPNWAPALMTADEAREGFYPLFNGEDLEGWWVRGSNKDAFRVEDGVLIVTGAPDGDWLFTDREYANYVLRYEYKCVSGEGNSGVAIRAPKEGNPAFAGFEIQVLRPGWETPYQRTGSLYSTVAAPAGADKPFGEWNECEILVDGPRIRATMNGQVLYDVLTTDYPQEALTEEWQKPLTDRPLQGHIGFQDHSDEVHFRRVRIQPLPGGEGWRPLFNGKDLTGWTVLNDPIWSVTDRGTLRWDGTKEGGWAGGRNAIRTNDEFSDFELRLMVLPGPHTNSGVFFRGSGDDPWPRTYEAQVDNHEPEKFTGSIWNQINATELRAKDEHWMQMVIRAKGPHIQIDVNGKTVVDYMSDRHGQFPGGWFSLQAHKENSWCEFKDIEIRDIEE